MSAGGTVPDVVAGSELRSLQSVWEDQARADPLWAVLSEPDKAGRRWDLDRFLATGRQSVTSHLTRFAQLGGTLPDRDLAVDFGCGVGRLSQALAGEFERVIGIDVSPTMVAVATRVNRHGDRVAYLLNEAADLSVVSDRTASLALTDITLQHMPPTLARNYLVELLRIVKPGGGLVFQLPSHYDESYLHPDRDDRPVPGDARQAEVVLTGSPARLPAGDRSSVRVAVTNRSGRTWFQTDRCVLNVGNHWLVPDGAPAAWDDGRGRLPGRIGAGETVVVDLTVTAPVEPGTYRLEVDVVQESVGWFGTGAGRGDDDPPANGCPLVVTEAGGPGAVPIPSSRRSSERQAFGDLISEEYFEAKAFEMHGIHRREVETLLVERGARLLGADELVTEWHSFVYYVQLPS